MNIKHFSRKVRWIKYWGHKSRSYLTQAEKLVFGEGGHWEYINNLDDSKLVEMRSLLAPFDVLSTPLTSISILLQKKGLWDIRNDYHSTFDTKEIESCNKSYRAACKRQQKLLDDLFHEVLDDPDALREVYLALHRVPGTSVMLATIICRMRIIFGMEIDPTNPSL